MKFNKLPVSYYTGRLLRGEHFAFAGYSDAEWFSMLKWTLGVQTGLGQILDGPTGNRLIDVMKRRQHDSNFLFAVPEVITTSEMFINAGIPDRMKSLLKRNHILVDFYERDMVTDTLAEHAGLSAWIKPLQQMRTVLIGNEALIDCKFLGYDLFFGIPSPNLHLDWHMIQRVANKIINHGGDSVYLFSAGMSAALLIDLVYDHTPNSSFLDLGSMWDAFVGIGGQRQWRASLYANPKKHREWIDANLQP